MPVTSHNDQQIAALKREIEELDRLRQEHNRTGFPSKADELDQPIAERRAQLKRRQGRKVA